MLTSNGGVERVSAEDSERDRATLVRDGKEEREAQKEGRGLFSGPNAGVSTGIQ
jgi:hypothetical protein